jgi:hypothetical protein
MNPKKYRQNPHLFKIISIIESKAYLQQLNKLQFQSFER